MKDDFIEQHTSFSWHHNEHDESVLGNQDVISNGCVNTSAKFPTQNIDWNEGPIDLLYRLVQ